MEVQVSLNLFFNLYNFNNNFTFVIYVQHQHLLVAPFESGTLP